MKKYLFLLTMLCYPFFTHAAGIPLPEEYECPLLVCTVDEVKNLNLRQELSEMTFALAYHSTNETDDEDYYDPMCSAVPIYFNNETKTGFLLTAAHCVTYGEKKAGVQIDRDNIIPLRYYKDRNADLRVVDSNHIALTPENTNNHFGLELDDAKVTAVYVYHEYLKPFAEANARSKKLYDIPGVKDENIFSYDLALLKVDLSNPGEDGLEKLPVGNFVLADEHLMIAELDHQKLLGLGYGENSHSNWFFLQYYNYDHIVSTGRLGLSTVLGAQIKSTMTNILINAEYYSPYEGMEYYGRQGLTRPGFSGGGVFYWDGTKLNLVGIHSGTEKIGSSAEDPGETMPPLEEVGKSTMVHSLNYAVDLRAFSDKIERLVIYENDYSHGCKRHDDIYGFICKD